MLTAAATAVGDMPSSQDHAASALLPPITQTSAVAVAVAIVVGVAAVSEGLAAPMTVEQITEQVEASFWHPVYRS